MVELRERDAMVCRACGKEERASEGYPCSDCGRFICNVCTMRGVVLCADCSKRAGVTPETPAAPQSISNEALNRLVRHAWPGNIRELRNVLERAMIVGRGAEQIEVRHLPADVRDLSVPLSEQHVARTLEEVERVHIERTLRVHNANRTHASRELGISRATLIKKIKEYGLNPRAR